MSCVLAIDSSGHGGSLALARDGQLLARRDHDPALGYAEELFGLLDCVLADAGLRFADIDAVAVVRGPGSFTGLRIGVMTAKSLAWARQTPLYASGTLELLASCAARAGFGRAIAVQDAGAAHVYAASFDLRSGPRMRGQPRRVALSEMIGVVTGERQEAPSTVLVPWGPQTSAALREAKLPADLWLRAEPLAERLALAASTDAEPAERVDPVSLVPLYVSRSQAERVHDVDLYAEVHRPVPPRHWE